MDRPVLFKLESGNAVVVTEIVGINGLDVLLSGGQKVAATKEEIESICELFQLMGEVEAEVDDRTWKPDTGV